jgi:sugar phosphate permease
MAQDGERIMAQPPTSAGTPDRWLVLFLAASSYFTLYLHRNLVNYLQPPIKAAFDVSDEQVGLLSTAFLLPYTLVQIGVGYLSDRLPRKAVLLVSLSGSALVLALAGLANVFGQLVALRVALALAQSASVPAIASLIADSFTPRARSTAIGIYLASYNLSLVVAGRYGGMLADEPEWELPLGLTIAGWRAAHLLFALVGGLVALMVLALLREPARTERGPLEVGRVSIGQALAAVLRVRTFWSLAVIFAMQMGVVASVQYWLPRYFHDRFGLSLQDAGLAATVWTQSATLAGLFGGGWLADRLARRLVPGRTLVQTAGIAVAGLGLLLLAARPGLAALPVPMVLFGLGTGMYQASLWAGTFEVVSPAARATAIGLLNVASGALSSWWGPLIGLYRDNGGDLGTALAFLSAPAALAAGLLLVNVFFLLPRDYLGPLLRKEEVRH